MNSQEKKLFDELLKVANGGIELAEEYGANTGDSATAKSLNKKLDKILVMYEKLKVSICGSDCDYEKPYADGESKLVNKVIAAMKKQIEVGDWTAIDELLRFVPKNNLINFVKQ